MSVDSKKKHIGLIATVCAGVVAILAAIIIPVAIMRIESVKLPIVGKYALYSYIKEDGTESTDEVTLIKAFGAEMTIEFKKDGTGEMVVDYTNSNLISADTPASEARQVQKFKWKGGKITDLESTTGGEPQSGLYDLSEDEKFVSIRVENDNKSIRFERIEEE